MKQTTIPLSKYKDLVDRLAYLEQVVIRIMAKIDEDEPAYGTDAWWEWSDKKAKEDIMAGRVISLKSEKDIDEFFDNL